MATPLRNFEPPNAWVDDQGRLTERAQGFLRSLFQYIGASQGQLPTETLGGDGVTTTTFLREDGSWAVPSYPVGANPSAAVGTTAVNGSALTFMRSDAAPALDLSITPTWTGQHRFNGGLRSDGGFGCNGAAPQGAVALGAAVGGSAGAAYTATEQTIINTLIARVNTILSTLKADGIGS